MRDVPPCLKLVGHRRLHGRHRVDLLWSDGTTAGGISPTSSASMNYTLAVGKRQRPAELDTNITAQDGSMEQHMVRNDLPCRTPCPRCSCPLTVPAGPQQGTGWRGAYVSAPIGPDPLGQRVHGQHGIPVDRAGRLFGGEGRSGTSWNAMSSASRAGPTNCTRRTSRLPRHDPVRHVP